MKDVVEEGQILLLGTSSLVNQQDPKPLIISALMDLAGVIGGRRITKPEKPFFVFLDEFYAAAYPGLNDLISLALEYEHHPYSEKKITHKGRFRKVGIG